MLLLAGVRRPPRASLATALPAGSPTLPKAPAHLDVLEAPLAKELHIHGGACCRRHFDVFVAATASGTPERGRCSALRWLIKRAATSARFQGAAASTAAQHARRRYALLAALNVSDNVYSDAAHLHVCSSCPGDGLLRPTLGRLGAWPARPRHGTPCRRMLLYQCCSSSTGCCCVRVRRTEQGRHARAAHRPLPLPCSCSASRTGEACAAWQEMGCRRQSVRVSCRCMHEQCGLRVP